MIWGVAAIVWRQKNWRVAERESGSPELLESPRTSPEVPQLPRKFFGDFPELLSLWNSTAIQGFPRSFPDFPRDQPLSLGSLTPCPDSQKLSLNGIAISRDMGPLRFEAMIYASQGAFLVNWQLEDVEGWARVGSEVLQPEVFLPEVSFAPTGYV